MVTIGTAIVACVLYDHAKLGNPGWHFFHGVLLQERSQRGSRPERTQSAAQVMQAGMQHRSGLPCDQQGIPTAPRDLAPPRLVEAAGKPAIPPPPASPMSPQPLHEASLTALFSLTPPDSSQVNLLASQTAQRLEANVFAPNASHAVHVDEAHVQGMLQRSMAQGDPAGPSNVIPLPPAAPMLGKFLDAEAEGVPPPSPYASALPSASVLGRFLDEADGMPAPSPHDGSGVPTSSACAK
jgi:hypothetical protein